MQKRRWCAIAFMIAVFTASPQLVADEAPDETISDREWNRSAKVWLARAMVAEAGWDETLDHVAIAYVLYRRMLQVRKHYPRISMQRVISQYCAGFGRHTYSSRQNWVRNLNADGSRPRGWPSDLSWRDYRERWLRVLELAEEWRDGVHPDPCYGLSRYWGGPMDRPSKRMIRMDCGETKNRFYTVKTLLPAPHESAERGSTVSLLP